MIRAATCLERIGFIARPIIQAHQQNTHGAFASQSESPNHIIRAARVVVDQHRLTRFEHRARAIEQVRLQASAAQQTCTTAVARDKHLCAGFAVGGTDRLYDRCEYEPIAPTRAVVEEWVKAANAWIHIGTERIAGIIVPA